MFTNTKIRTKILPSLKFSLQYFNTTSCKKKCDNKKRFSKNEPKNTLNDNKKSHELKVLPVSRINCDKRIISAENTARFVFDEVICKQSFFSQILFVQRTLFKHSSLSTNTEKFRTNRYHAPGNGITKRFKKNVNPAKYKNRKSIMTSDVISNNQLPADTKIKYVDQPQEQNLIDQPIVKQKSLFVWTPYAVVSFYSAFFNPGKLRLLNFI